MCEKGTRVRLHDFLDYWAREQPAEAFVVAGGRSLSYGDAAGLANRLAGRLVAADCGKGSRVAILAKNADWYLLLYFAAAKAGVVLLPVNWRLAPREWVAILTEAQPSVLIADRHHAGAVDEIRPELDGIDAYVAEGPAGARGWESLERRLAEGPATPPAVEVGVTDPLYQMYTSDTTSAPRGAILSHDAVTANVVQVHLPHTAGPGDRGLVVLPMFHAAVIPAALSVVCYRRDCVRPRRLRPAPSRPCPRTTTVATAESAATSRAASSKHASARSSALRLVRSVQGDGCRVSVIARQRPLGWDPAATARAAQGSAPCAGG